MAPTPQITLRVPPEQLEKWKAATSKIGVNVSEVIRQLMDEWAETVNKL